MGNVVITDKQGTILGVEDYFTAIEKELTRFIVRIFIFNTKGQLFLQKRSMKVHAYPGCWDSSAAGHVDPGEDALTAAKREVVEELGIKDLILLPKLHFYNEKQCRDKLFRTYDAIFFAQYEGSFILAEAEVSDGKWFDLE